ncbi:hypothetical protein DPMN_069602, partial [Dreissena polymorpha]
IMKKRQQALSLTPHVNISDEDLTAIVKQTLEEFPKSGERILIAILHQKGLRVSIHEIKRSARCLSKLQESTVHQDACEQIWVWKIFKLQNTCKKTGRSLYSYREKHTQPKNREIMA